jgi:hypothetical protein
MKFLQYNKYKLLFALLPLAVVSSCVKSNWDNVKQPALLAPNQFVETLDENFDNVSFVDGLHLVAPQGWLNIGRNGNRRAFQAAVITDTALKKDTLPDGKLPKSKVARCAAASAYLALGDTTDSWLVTPPLKIVDSEPFTFTAAFAYNFASGKTVERATVEVRYHSASSASDVAPTLSKLDDWTLLETISAKPEYDVNAPADSVNLAVWFHFYPHSYYFIRGAVDDVVYVAFRYLNIPMGHNCNTWYFDDVKYNK